jgi:phage replication-related protein YjqB (UPF0714/DUF867 family)
MPAGDDTYCSMTDLYADPSNVEGETYGKRWRRHEWSQLVEAQATDNPETEKIVLAIHGGGIETGTSELALAVAGFDPDTLSPAADGRGLHDFWLFEGLLSKGNGRLHVTASNFDDPIARELVKNARRCISLHGCRDDQANGKIQVGGLDKELRGLVLEELDAADIPAELATSEVLNGNETENIGNRTKVKGCAQLEMGTTFRSSLFGIDTRPRRKNTTKKEFWALAAALRAAFSRVS